MTEIPETNQPAEPITSAEPTAVPRRRSPIRRAGCIIAVLVWFLILLLPCFLIVLAVQQEIVISTGSAPGQQTRLWLISEADQRGLALSTASSRESNPNAVCVETNVHFYLWTGKSDPLSYCDCYQRDKADSPWSQVSTEAGACTAG